MGNCFSSDHSSQQLDPEVREPAVRQQSSRQPAGPSNPTATVQSTNTARPQIPGNALCSHCKAIPWDRLPSEEEPGYGHKPSLDALRQSAQSCSLCSFLLRATEDMKRIAPPEEGQRISSRSFIPLRFGDIRVEEVRYGRTFSACDDVDGSTADFYKVPPYFNRDYPRGPLRPFLFGSWWRFKGSPTPDQLVGLGVRLGTTPLIEDGEGNQRAWSQENRNVEEHVTFHGTFIRLRVVDDSPLARIVPGRIRTLETDWGLALDRINKFVHDCVSEHQCVAEESPLPTRLLDIGTDAESPVLRLVNTAGQRGSYITLSHCWGEGLPLRTTRGNFDSHRCGIRVAELPPKFQDSIKITRLLRKRYLWIDALCIIQDDPADWETEVSRMASVYANAWLTVAAAGSGSTSQGIFNPVDPNTREFDMSPDQASVGLGAPTVLFAIRMSSPDSVTIIARENTYALFSNLKHGMIVLTYEWMPSSRKPRPNTYCIPYFGAPVDVLKDQPLSDRAWTLQERALAPRTLHICSDQIYWECRRGMLCEDGSRIDRSSFSLPSIRDRQLVPESELGLCGDHTLSIVMHRTENGDLLPIEGYPPPILSEKPYGRWDGGWLALIEEYSLRNMTNPEDKLPALSGIAQAIHEATNDEYLAGLWRNQIFEDLCWRTYHRNEVNIQRPGGFTFLTGEVERTPERPPGYRAPSWSWASLDAAIIHTPLDYTRILCRYVDSHINRSQIDRFGKVGGGSWIRLESSLAFVHAAPASFVPSPYEPLGHGKHVAIVLGDQDQVSFGVAFFDLPADETYPCYALFLDSSNALLLKSLNWNDFSFMRIGIAMFLRTQAQRVALPMNGEYFSQRKIPYGPLSADWPKADVMIY